MKEFLAMGGHGAFVWSAYFITLAVIVWNIVSARLLLRRARQAAARDSEAREPGKRPTVSQI